VDVLRSIRKRGVRAGITLNPETPAEAISGVLPEVDEVLCMTVHPGFGGQSFIRQVLPKIRHIRSMAPKLDISVDGGLNRETTALCAAEGANLFLVGTALFHARDMGGEMREIRDGTQSALRKAGF
jgi:ribulose-phosphate 3-epimerase